MSKNAVITFLFAFVPGAGQMYQGYMKRGLSMATLFAFSIVLTWVLNPLGMFIPVIWMYSFFDTFNLRSRAQAGQALQDDYLVHLGADESLRRLMKTRHKLVGWCIVGLSIYMLYSNFVLPPLRELYWNVESFRWLSVFIYDLPKLVVALVLLAVGLWLVRGPRAAAPGDNQEIPSYKGEC